MLRGLAYIAITLTCITDAASAQETDSNNWHQSVRTIETHASEWLKKNNVPSVSVAMIYDGKVAWAGTFGEQSPSTSATNGTLYNVASLAKPVTAEIFLRLAQSGDIQLDEPLWSYWTDPAIADDPRKKWLTPRISLSHQTGFPNWRHERPDRALDIRWDPGTQFGYSGEGYQYAAKAAENKLSLSFEELANERLFKPLGLKHISYTYRTDFGDKVATPFGPDGTYGAMPQHTDWNAAGDVLATSSDYARFLLAVMNNEGLNHKVAARRYVVDHPGEANICDDAYNACPLDAESGYALGWGVLKYQDETIIMHRGGDWGIRSLAYFVPETGFGLVVLTNGSNGEAVIRDVVSAFHANDHWLDILHK